MGAYEMKNKKKTLTLFSFFEMTKKQPQKTRENEANSLGSMQSVA